MFPNQEKTLSVLNVSIFQAIKDIHFHELVDNLKEIYHVESLRTLIKMKLMLTFLAVACFVSSFAFTLVRRFLSMYSNFESSIEYLNNSILKVSFPDLLIFNYRMKNRITSNVYLETLLPDFH